MSGLNQTSDRFYPASRPPSNDYGNPGYQNNSKIQTNAVEILPNITGKTNRERIPQFASEPVQSADCLIDSANRVSGSQFNFTADIGATVFRPRLVSVDSVVLPKLFNVNPKNNTVRIQFALVPGSGWVSAQQTVSPIVSFTIPPGYYSPTTFTSVFKTTFDNTVNGYPTFNPYPTTDLTDWHFTTDAGTPHLLQSFGPPDFGSEAFFDARQNRVIFYSTSGGNVAINWSEFAGGGGATGTETGTVQWWFVDCPFTSKYARNFVPVQAQAQMVTMADPVPAFTSNTSITDYDISIWNDNFGSSITTLGIPSGLAGFDYTRFCTLSSNALNRFAYDESRVSRVGAGGGRGKIVAVVDTSLYQIEGTTFGGTFLPAQYPNAPFINVNNPQGQLEQYLDFIVRDEFGENLDDLFPYSQDQIGITFWLKVTF